MAAQCSPPFCGGAARFCPAAAEDEVPEADPGVEGGDVSAAWCSSSDSDDAAPADAEDLLDGRTV